MIVVIAGGVGAARYLSALRTVVPPGEITAIANVADDLNLGGLAISPDLDTITYTLAWVSDTETGWGLEGETWQAMATLERLGGPSWFSLGDRDLGTHLYRTQRLAEGATLTEVTAEVARGWGVEIDLRPVTDDRLRTMITLATGPEVTFQDYFVRRAHAEPVTSVRFDGAETARPAPGVLEAIESAERVVIAPSNPLVSIDPVLAVPGVRDALMARRDDVVAISPIVGGRALKGPADRLLAELGHEPSVVGVARWCVPFASSLLIDTVDADHADAVATAGLHPVVLGTVMDDPDRSAALARASLEPASR